MAQLQRAGEVWTPSAARGDDPLGSVVKTFDYPPRSPRVENLEVIQQAPDIIPGGWTVVGNSGGSAPTLQTVGGFWDNLAPNTNSHSINSDAPGKWLMVPAGAKSIVAYRAFQPGAGIEFAVVAKLNLYNFIAGTADDRIALTLDKTQPTSTTQDYGQDSLTVEWRPYTGGIDFNSVPINAGVAGARASITTGNPGVYHSSAYLAITCESNDALSAWMSRDGGAWQRIQRYTTNNIIANVNYVLIGVRDDTGSAGMIGGFEWIRFLVGDNRASKLGFGA